LWDIKPVAKYNSDKTYYDKPITDLASSAFTPVEASTVDLCKESWVYGDSMVACVKIEGSITRPFTTTDAGDNGSP
jgi:hypothetical protein